jgi:hypothetical protein
MNNLLTIWVIYQNPRDFPGKWVLRGQTAGPGGVITPLPQCVVVDSLDEARTHVPYGLVCMTRHPDDDPVIYEVWL